MQRLVGLRLVVLIRQGGATMTPAGGAMEPPVLPVLAALTVFTLWTRLGAVADEDLVFLVVALMILAVATETETIPGSLARGGRQRIQ